LISLHQIKDEEMRSKKVAPGAEGEHGESLTTLDKTAEPMSYGRLFITQYFMAAYQVINNKRKTLY
jgi:hypothetical protein